ncbi:hypothetical protein SO802_005113 [Lithocarpus litseifolius]|uniref:CCHC-type domain-containing protein n=1 Tax=Lithocarpus litseifolius TaxID=425828 RepID=A0AAW2DH83_9ROSI
MHADYAFDVEETSLEEGVAAVGVSKEDKVRIRALWNLTLIVKTFGRNVGFLYLSTKIRTQGNPIDSNSKVIWNQFSGVRFPELPIEYYEPTILRKIGQSIGPVLRIDAHTISSSRGRCARLCIQVNLERPLIRKVMVGKLAIKVQYEGINSLCFACGRIGHLQEAYPALSCYTSPTRE